MALKWTTRRPPLRLYGSWEGDNLAELEGAFPTWTFQVNPNGTLHASDGRGFDGDLNEGDWFCYDAVYEQDPTLTDEVQEAPGPGPVSFNLTAD